MDGEISTLILMTKILTNIKFLQTFSILQRLLATGCKLEKTSQIRIESLLMFHHTLKQISKSINLIQGCQATSTFKRIQDMENLVDLTKGNIIRIRAQPNVNSLRLQCHPFHHQAHKTVSSSGRILRAPKFTGRRWAKCLKTRSHLQRHRRGLIKL